MARRKLTTKNAKTVFENIMALHEEDRKVVLARFDDVLSDLANDDFFGTERQCDPRGDGRND